MYVSDMDFFFIVKILMQTSPYQMIFSAFFISIGFFGVALRICESVAYRGEVNTLKDYENAFWCIIITKTTIGYGDYFPITLLGRTINVFVCVSIAKQSGSPPSRILQMEAEKRHCLE